MVDRVLDFLRRESGPRQEKLRIGGSVGLGTKSYVVIGRDPVEADYLRHTPTRHVSMPDYPKATGLSRAVFSLQMDRGGLIGIRKTNRDTSPAKVFVEYDEGAIRQRQEIFRDNPQLDGISIHVRHKPTILIEMPSGPTLAFDLERYGHSSGSFNFALFRFTQRQKVS